jgi:hypothetical protein
MATGREFDAEDIVEAKVKVKVKVKAKKQYRELYEAGQVDPVGCCRSD